MKSEEFLELPNAESDVYIESNEPANLITAYIITEYLIDLRTKRSRTMNNALH